MARPREASKGGLVLINKTDFTSSTSVNINTCFSSTYDNYRVLFNILSTSTNFDPLHLRMRSGTTDNSSNNYKYHVRYFNYGGSGGDSTSSAFSSFPVGSVDAGAGNTGIGIKGSVDIIGPFLTSNTSFSSLQTQYNYGFYGTGIMTVSTSYDGFSLVPNSGNITGSVQVYGYRK